MQTWIDNKKQFLWFRVLRTLLIGVIAFLYLFVGYHVRDHIIDFDNGGYKEHPGVVQSEYIMEPDQFDVILSSERWLSNVSVGLVMILLASVLLLLIGLKVSHFKVGIVTYGVLVVTIFVVMMVISLLKDVSAGYAIARFIKDHYIHTPFVFIILAASLRVFKV
jgi:hypothetical protein